MSVVFPQASGHEGFIKLCNNQGFLSPRAASPLVENRHLRPHTSGKRLLRLAVSGS
jgi:hypothetical protein